jgi:hypothetical protein
VPNLTVSCEQYELLESALSDAVYYRDPPVNCRSCEALNDETKLCAECAELLGRSRAYLVLGNELGMTASA